MFPPAVIIHSLAHAQSALQPGRPVTLLSAEGAAQYAGVLWWRELVRAANHTGPAFLDCGNAPGRALEALKLGVTGLILRTNPLAFAEAAAIAAAQSATLLPNTPPALDLAQPGADRHLLTWLDKK